jgi:5-methylcytosine-specific restriction protein B
MDMTVADLVDAALSAHDSQWHERADAGLRGLFGGPKGRYESRALGNATVIRAPRLDQDGVPFAALIHPDNPTSGAYGGMSVVLFPIEPGRALVALVVGTSGLADDAHVLGRPGHARKVRALTNWLNSRFGNGALIAWAKTDPTRIDQTIPTDIASRFEGCQSVFSRYGHVIYGFALITTDAPEIARQIITAVFDMYMSERQVALLRAFQEESRSVQAQYLAQLLPAIQGEALRDIILRRRYVILEGPPGTGKTRLAQLMLKDHFNNCGMSIQFHPNTTYQEFVGGLAPETSSHGLGIAFKPRPGVLMEAARAALADAARPYLLHIDEINRADLAKVLGEAIYLLEPMTELPRRIRLSFDSAHLSFRSSIYQTTYLSSVR